MLAARFVIAGRALLAASVLLTGTITPGISHAHGEGSRAHEHQAAREHAHKHSHYGHSHASRNDQRALPVVLTDSAGFCSGCTQHVHISCFGWSFTLPAESKDGESDFDASGSPAVVIVRPLDVMATTALSESSIGAALWALEAFEATDCSTSALTRPRFSCTPIAVRPLCDTARHERSGVQLS